jgi:hypothetical protein
MMNSCICISNSSRTKQNSTKNKLIKQNKNPESEQTQFCKSELNISMNFCASGERNETHVGCGDRKWELWGWTYTHTTAFQNPQHYLQLTTVDLPIHFTFLFRFLGFWVVLGGYNKREPNPPPPGISGRVLRDRNLGSQTRQRTNFDT